jgi:hypothetical protein
MDFLHVFCSETEIYTNTFSGILGQVLKCRRGGSGVHIRGCNRSVLHGGQDGRSMRPPVHCSPFYPYPVLHLRFISTTCTIVSILLSHASPTQQGIKVLLILIFFKHTCFLFVCSCILLFCFEWILSTYPEGYPFTAFY